MDVTWHSPEFVDGNPTRLADMIIRILRDFYNSEKKETIKSLANKLRESAIMRDSKFETDSSAKLIEEHGRILERDYGIKQLIFTSKINY